ncbi:hypothetical protein GCM10028795_19570 [Lysobacter olei]
MPTAARVQRINLAEASFGQRQQATIRRWKAAHLATHPDAGGFQVGLLSHPKAKQCFASIDAIHGIPTHSLRGVADPISQFGHDRGA